MDMVVIVPWSTRADVCLLAADPASGVAARWYGDGGSLLGLKGVGGGDALAASALTNGMITKHTEHRLMVP